jgi:PAS domain S-box-containing protein
LTFRIRFRPQPRFEQVSERLAALAGHTPAEHYADASVWLRVAIPEDRQLQADVLCGAAGGEEPVVVRWRSADGGIRYVEQQTAPLPDERGAVAGLVGIVRDLTEARRAEAELKEVTQRLSAHIDNSPLGVVEFDRQYRIMRWSKESERMFGWKAEEVLGRSISELKWVYEDDLEAVESESAQLMSGALARSVNVNRNYAKDGRVVYCEWYNSAIHDDEGRLRSVLSLVLDVTDRKQAEEALKKSEYWLRESQRASRIGTYLLDVRTGTWASSETLDEIFGIGGEFRRDVEGWKELVHPEQREEMASYFFEQVIGRGQPFDREYRIQRKSDGEVRWVLGRGALLRDEAGSIVHVTGTIQDVTERRQMEEDLRQALKMESIGRLAGGLAHDFNNLLTVINGYSTLLAGSGLLHHSLKASVEQIRQAGERAAALTQQMLAFSRRQLLQPKILDLNAVVQETEKMLVRLIGEDIRLEMKLGVGLWPVKADEGQLGQVLLNLAANARDAMPEGGVLTIETKNAVVEEGDGAEAEGRKAGPAVVLRVTDTGTGMDEVTRRHMFEPFYTTKPAGGGTGLGLSTVYGVVRQSGGWIEVQSLHGEGTQFEIFLPRAEGAVQEEAEMPEREPAGGGGETVLVVEDQESVRELAARLLKRLGYQVLQAGDGGEALGLAEKWKGRISLLITDMVMPGLSGPALAKRMRERRPALPVIYMSGYSDEMVAGRGRLETAGYFLQKPFRLDEFAETVREALRAGPADSAQL